MTAKTAIVAIALVVSGTAQAQSSGQPLFKPFDWDRYQARQDACLEKDHIEAACSRGWCDRPALRRAIRACSAVGPPAEREPSQ